MTEASGTPTPETDPEDPIDSVGCPRCGRIYDPDEIVCVECGTDLMTGEKVGYGTSSVREPTIFMFILLVVMALATLLRWWLT